MPNGSHFDRPAIYQLEVSGQLGDEWSDWFDGFSISHLEGELTRLAGPVRDQAALHGLLAKVRDLGLPLVSVRRMGVHPQGAQEAPAGHGAAPGARSGRPNRVT